MAKQDDPDWWTTAIGLEAQGKLGAAEKVIRRALDPQGEPSSAQIAYLYELRCRRLAKEGRFEEARAAAETGYSFMCEYASGATSGCEGIALSQEANLYRKTLDKALRQAEAKAVPRVKRKLT
ncbi:MAG: hypothetical protein KDB00_00945 [Planctomycetales bacterium]|nr:hypothetical protein [Planctomycetales bacterium]